MKNLVFKISIAGFLAYAVYAGSMAMFCAAIGSAIAFYLSRSAGIGAKLAMAVIGAIAGGLGGEIARTFWQHARSTELVSSGHFLDAIIGSLICAAVAIVAISCDKLLRDLASRRS